MSTHSLFHLKDIHFRYEEETVFRDFSMEIKSGEKLAVKGESGSGKTTLFRLLLGFEYPAQGTLLYKGNTYSPGTIRQLREEVVWLPQDLNLGAGNTFEMINFIFDFQSNIDLKPNRNKIINILEQLGLGENTLESKFSDLSTGQRQRVGLATCHLLNKKVMMLDEPTSALDEQSKQKVVDLIRKDDITIVSTSHDPWWLEKCDRIIELENQS